MMDLRSPSSQQLRKKLHELYEDRLSTLPKNAIECILVSLPLRDAVRTSILSHDWRYEWHNLPVLVFDLVNFPLGQNQSQVEYDSKLVQVVDHVLLLHQGPINTFTLPTDLQSCINIDKWILFLSRSGVRVFILEKWIGWRYKVPSCLFTFKELTSLVLCRCIISPASFNGFKKLQKLDLQRVTFQRNGLENLISNCPLLSKLVLRHVGGCTHVKLYAPNLIDIEVENSFEDLAFVTTPLLAYASFELWSTQEYQSSRKGSICKLVNILGGIPGIKMLELSDYSYQFLSAGDIPATFPATCQLLYLSLMIDLEDIQHLLVARCIFKSSPLLQEVVIESISHESNWAISVKDFWEAHEDFNCLFTHLRILYARYYTGTISELKFIELVLANAPVLETVTIELQEDMIDDVTEMKKVFLEFQRISLKAEIIFEE